jgi:trypsin
MTVIAHVAKPFEVGPYVKPVPLNKNALRPGAVVVLSGWGDISEDGGLAITLQKVEVPIVPQWECKWMYAHTVFSDYMFCGGRAGRDSCQGDSGGPVVANGLLVGVVSWGEGCACPGYPGIYASVEKLCKGIVQNSGV